MDNFKYHITMAVVSSICNVRLLPLDIIRHFSVIDGEVSLGARQDKIEYMDIVPGSGSVSDEDDGSGKFTKKIAFKVKGTFRKEREYRRFNTLKVVMMYQNEVGETRVSGSLSNPLSVKITRQGGLIQFSLTGTDSTSDGILVE